MSNPTSQFLKEVNVARKRLDDGRMSSESKYRQLFRIFEQTIHHLTDQIEVQFTTLFARLAFLTSQYEFNNRERFILQSFRRRKPSEKEHSDLVLAQTAISILLNRCLNSEEDLGMISVVYKNLTRGREVEIRGFLKELKVVIQSLDFESGELVAQQSSEPFAVIQVSFTQTGRNEDYLDLMKELDQCDILPISANLINVEITSQGLYIPESIVFEPDYLYDVTSISECFGPFSNNQASFLFRKFAPRPLSRSILIGNLANYFLDSMVYNPNKSFEEFVTEIFSRAPLVTSLLSDDEVKEMIGLLKKHYSNIRNVVTQGLQTINVYDDSCQVEPSFYSIKYGIQGRLDLFSIFENESTIIELKSGKPYRANSYGLANNHYHQTLLYDMLIESVYKNEVKRKNFILYSIESDNPLRFAPIIKAEQRELIKERNRLFLHDRRLMSTENFVTYYREYFKKHEGQISGFLNSDFKRFFKAFSNLDRAEISYCNHLLKFTLRELFMSKLGIRNSDKNRGLAAMWQLDIKEKEEQFSILNYLKIIEDYSHFEDPILVFSFSENSAFISNFRIGDLGVLYQYNEGDVSVLKNQVFKVTILSITSGKIEVRLRSRQDNPRTFSKSGYWNIEHDSLENGYNDMSRSIYEFARADKAFRDLLLTKKITHQKTAVPYKCSQHLTEEQRSIFQEAIRAKDYYLLWGPPGTGKTSVMIRELAKYYMTEEEGRVLLVAYTNRAVDEICAALLSIDEDLDFVRIGSRYSTDQKYRKYLLERKIASIRSRKQLIVELKGYRFYVGTVASILGKAALFELLKFDEIVIDEASQILEPSLIGLLSRFKKFILIGDHLQLPAVVQQTSEQSAVQDQSLIDLGITQISSSLFERMYKTLNRKNGSHAYGQLTFQGRMHREIMDFVNVEFYDGTLKLLPGLERIDADSYLDDSNWKERIYFGSSDVDYESTSLKINLNEARLVAKICFNLKESLIRNGKIYGPNSIGVITPYRAQISAIKQELKRIDLDLEQLITVDTVERYQGGSRDIIVMSTCMNFSYQLKSLVSLSENGKDRKLNVALTRAKELFILIGNENILRQNKTYKALINTSTRLELKEY